MRVGHSTMTRSWSVDRFSMRCDTTGCHFTTNACPVSFRSFNVFKTVQNRNATNLIAGICVLVRSLDAIHQNMTKRPITIETKVHGYNIYVWHTSRILVARQSTDLHEMYWSQTALIFIYQRIRSLPSNSLKQRLDSWSPTTLLKNLLRCYLILFIFFIFVLFLQPKLVTLQGILLLIKNGNILLH